ncbi:hypothetical protein ES288_D06G065400v1 [Gossypium darwinii]|uniref:BSD domain-containing protein n=1 Tax=Gossypium darwinii TaxID=34276 RepID=A0A5D2C2N5_GOSDA|nr:hypothetical protein ES288_D06G065400v1 [Gossypium darwinii]
MSWLLKSLQSEVPRSPTSSPDHSPTNLNGGVKDDLSLIGETIGRQLRGVAAFLAPPPSQPSVTASEGGLEQEQVQEPQSDKLLGIRNDLAEIGGSFKSGLSLLSSNRAVTEISRFASSLLQFPDQDDHGGHDEDDDDEDYDDGVPGITDEVIKFVEEISNRPELWTDFPLSLHNDFKMSEDQIEHAENVEHLVPSFEALRVGLQHNLGDERFWMIYFILLLPRLNEHDFEVLSSPEVIETRDALLQKLQKNKNVQVENSSPDASQQSGNFSETKRETFVSEEKVSEIVNAAEGLEITSSEDNTEQWLEEAEFSSGSSLSIKKNLEHEEDVSFSDLEDDDTDTSNRASVCKSTQHDKALSSSGSNDWVQLNKRLETRGALQKAGQTSCRDKDSEVEESNDWLTDDDFVDVVRGK